MEAKILELFALMFSDVTTVSREVRKRQLTSGDRARLHMAELSVPVMSAQAVSFRKL